MANVTDLKLPTKILLQYSMQYGFVLGIFWFFRYFFLIYHDLYAHLFNIYSVLTVGTLLLYYVLVNRYRDRALNGAMGYRQCILFSTLLFFFASLIESVIIYVHIAVINPNFLSQNGPIAIHIIEELIKGFWSSTQTINVAKPLKLASNAEYIINNIYVSTLYGFLLSLFYGIFVRRKKTTPKE